MHYNQHGSKHFRLYYWISVLAEYLVTLIDCQDPSYVRGQGRDKAERQTSLPPS